MRILLIGGGGTLGTYTAEELLELGHSVDIVCPEEKTSENPHLRFFRGYATYDFLEKILKTERYDGIVNFILYTSLEDYIPFHKLLSANTDHLIFLSSYRVYADLQHPVTESAPQLFDVVKDRAFLENEKYAVPKSMCERYIKNESKFGNWTIVRPVISFSQRRYDIVFAHPAEEIQKHIADKMPINLPAESRNLTAGVDWAKNSGILIADLLFKEKALKEDFTVSSAQNLKWGEVADIYTKLSGLKFNWIPAKEYFNNEPEPYIYTFDRAFDRTIDNRKILSVTGLDHESFCPIEQGIKTELNKILYNSI